MIEKVVPFLFLSSKDISKDNAVQTWLKGKAWSLKTKVTVDFYSYCVSDPALYILQELFHSLLVTLRGQ